MRAGADHSGGGGVPSVADDGGDVLAASVGEASKGSLREDNRCHFIRLEASVDYDKSIEGGDGVGDVSRVEGRSVAELDMVFVTFDNECHNHRRTGGQVVVGEGRVGGGSRYPMAYHGHEGGVVGVAIGPVSGWLEEVGEIWCGGGHGGVELLE
jgi:hypothetical protein